ncbi:Ribonuclease/ribotoxin [Corynascus novoguineensis]|uniref:ribonuclease T1 n=1 Tax=Corynascus novoguineensis TaxID=1126955 RepID=A0AAN7CSQ7_9PEZI|nr:Ribonuclease/ribotoxin [Corynascus novoguineensis]
MRKFISTLTLGLCAVATTANAKLEPRQGTDSLSSVTCGSTTYSKQDVDAAVAEGCRLYAAGEQLGNSRYPHRFNNRERLTFDISGPYEEFPILANGAVYSGRAPGPDRIVFNPDYRGSCVYAGAMTHTGAPTRNGFVECDDEDNDDGNDDRDDDGDGNDGDDGFPSGTATSTTSQPTATRTFSNSEPTSSTDPEGNAAARIAGSIGGQGVVMGAVGVVAGLLML